MHSGEAVQAGTLLDEALILDAQRGDAEACAVIDEHARAGGTHSPEWHAMRRTGLGGSDVAACLGLNPYRAPIDVYTEKIGELEGFAGNERTQWGQILEPVIAKEYQRRRGGPDICTLRGPLATERSADRPWHLFTLDYLADELDAEMCVVEIKSRGFFMRREYGDEGTDEIPFSDLCQGTWYVAGAGCDGGLDLAVLFNTHELRVFHAERDLELEASLLERCEQWWRDHVVERVPPEADGSKEYARYLRRRFDKTTRDLRTPSDDDLELHRRLRAVECLWRTVDAAREKLRQQLQVRIGDAEGFELPDELGKKSMFKHDRRGRVNHSAVAEDLANELKLSHKGLKLLQDSHRYKPLRKWYSPRPWLKDQPSFSAAEDDLRGVLDEPKPE